MPVLIESTPREFAQITRWLHRSDNVTERNERLARAPLPAGPSISFRIDGSATFDQDRLHLSSEMAANMRRVWGIVGALRDETLSANTLTPASAQIALRLNFLEERPVNYHDFFARAAAYSASYEPRIATGNPCTLKSGDIGCGILERPHSKDRNSAALARWDFGVIAEWAAFAPFTVFQPGRFNDTHTDIFALPQLGGTHFARKERLSMSIAPPLVPNEVMRAISARTRNLNAADAEILQISLSRCDGSIGCACDRCAQARNAPPNGVLPLPPADARPAPPNVPPPRLQIPATISEDSPLAMDPIETDRYGANLARRAPNTRSATLRTIPTLSRPKPRPPMRAVPVLEDSPLSPRSISHCQIADAPGVDLISMNSNSATHISAPSEPSSTPLAELNEWYLANMELRPTTPVNLHRTAEVFELQTAIPDIDPLASWYRGDE